MIIFGTRSREIRPKQATSYDCDNCNSKGTVNFIFLAKYLHIFWIPVLPLSKKGISQCSHCKQVRYQNEMTPKMKQDCATASATAKRPITHYFGLFLIGFLFCLIVFNIFKNSANKAEYLASPKINDVYEVKENDLYTLYKISEIKGDTLVFKMHNKAVERSSGLFDLKKNFKNDYSNDVIKMDKNWLKTMSDKGYIMGVNRE
ncbi:ribosomal protein L37AE/L43A [Flavobacterium arsenatis]|uniref:Ribosomal protein L37AE/L43A n=1 Tax=Flavobacterium arsenatis TaxID=1484332 RepID=A0ABU1TUP1_9FLAO|nr:hypothetical protein [Flavobacterium arsenatis]MDR6969599.1 ribosomal protein L37AE/L43A [Flavobacterium arsenatis]